MPWSGKVGQTIKILGTDLTGATSVTFNGTAATFTVVSATEITATVPTGLMPSQFLKVITFVVFVMMRSIPGDPVVALLGDAFTEEDAVKVRKEYEGKIEALLTDAIETGSCHRCLRYGGAQRARCNRLRRTLA